MGYDSQIEKSIFAKNVVVGNPDEDEIVFTAHYDPPPRLPKFFVKHMLFHSFISLPLIIMDILYLFKLYNAVIAYKNCFVVALPVFVCSFLGYMFGCLGGANKKNYNDNSSGCVALLNLMDRYKTLPHHLRKKIAFVFTDNEEKMLLGSFTHKAKHKNYKEKTYINLDCVGRGKNFNLYYFGKQTEISEDFSKSIAKIDGFQATLKKSNIMSKRPFALFKSKSCVFA